jgi:uncharacterized protein
MKCTLLLTQDCNLDCSYCYVRKREAVMDLETAAKIIDFVYARTAAEEVIHFGFFGGEPLLQFGLLKDWCGW